MPSIRRYAQRLLSLAIVAVVLAGIAVGTTPTRASATEYAKQIVPVVKLPAGVVKGWSNPRSDNFFTGPHDKRFVTTLKQALKAMPTGATVRLSTYALSDRSVVDALIDAKGRGINVRFTSWTVATNSLIKKLRKVLGSDTTKASYLMLCRGSCYSKGADKSSQHAKTVTISSVFDAQGNRVRNIVFVTSANFSQHAVTDTWNHSQLIVGCAKIYTALASYMDGMKYDKTKRNFKPVSSCGYTLYLFPSAHMSNPAYDALAHTKCQATKSSKTIVRIMMYVWTPAEMKAVTQLGRLQSEHCDVAVVVTSGESRTGKKIVDALKRYHIRTFDSRYQGRYLHAKIVVIRGRVGKKLVDSVWSGSANFSWSAIARNTDTQLRSNGASIVNKALTFFARVAHASKQLYPAKKK